MAFLIYAVVVSRIRLYVTSGRNASNSASGDGDIELTTPSTKWYARVPNADADADADADTVGVGHHVIGEDDD